MLTENPQRDLWNAQHSRRGVHGVEAKNLRDTPNDTALILAGHLFDQATIFEVGSANGRDARYWAGLGHKVIATDFSPIALDQLRELAEIQGVCENIQIIEWDISCGKIPPTVFRVDAFYARSALHISDEAMTILAGNLNCVLKLSGLIVIEGKSDCDEKIVRSISVGANLVADPHENDHLRRVWTEDFCHSMCDRFGWNVLQLERVQETHHNADSEFLRLVAQKSQ